VQTVTDVFHRRGGEEAVLMYRVMLKEPTTLHAPFLIRAPLSRVAKRTALCMFYASVPKAAQEAMPNLDPDLATCVQVHDSGIRKKARWKFWSLSICACEQTCG